VSLTLGTGPFGHSPTGTFNSPMPDRKGLLYFEDSPRWIRARLGGETVVDSRRTKLLHEHRCLPIYYFPKEDVRGDLLEPTRHATRCPHKGEASYWSVRVGDRVAENAVWSYLDPIEGAGALAGYRALYWDSMDEWLEEDEPGIVHARDPYHRIDVLDTSRHVKVMLEGEVVAETRRSKVLFETGLPPRWYIPLEDVHSELLVESDRRTGCAYKGFASYWSVRAGGIQEDDLVWTYKEPRREAGPIAGYLAFFNERADLEIDGELQERPRTQWSRGRRRALDWTPPAPD
jgi:uncharacterized protein (DUF427 family)